MLISPWMRTTIASMCSVVLLFHSISFAALTPKQAAEQSIKKESIGSAWDQSFVMDWDQDPQWIQVGKIKGSYLHQGKLMDAIAVYQNGKWNVVDSKGKSFTTSKTTPKPKKSTTVKKQTEKAKSTSTPKAIAKANPTPRFTAKSVQTKPTIDPDRIQTQAKEAGLSNEFANELEKQAQSSTEKMDVQAWLKDPNAPMPDASKIKQKQIKEVIAFSKALQPTPTPTPNRNLETILVRVVVQNTNILNSIQAWDLKSSNSKTCKRAGDETPCAFQPQMIAYTYQITSKEKKKGIEIITEKLKQAYFMKQSYDPVSRQFIPGTFEVSIPKKDMFDTIRFAGIPLIKLPKDRFENKFVDVVEVYTIDEYKGNPSLMNELVSYGQRGASLDGKSVTYNNPGLTIFMDSYVDGKYILGEVPEEDVTAQNKNKYWLGHEVDCGNDGSKCSKGLSYQITLSELESAEIFYLD